MRKHDWHEKRAKAAPAPRYDRAAAYLLAAQIGQSAGNLLAPGGCELMAICDRFFCDRDRDCGGSSGGADRS